MRVHSFRKTGVSYSSESWKARLAKRRASSESAGSSMGILAETA